MHWLETVASWILGAVTLSASFMLVTHRISKKKITKGARATQFQKGGHGSINFQAGNDIRIEDKDLQE